MRFILIYGKCRTKVHRLKTQRNGREVGVELSALVVFMFLE